MKRWLLNLEARVGHDRDHLTEECNTDQVQHREYSPFLPEGFRACQHCCPEEPLEPVA